jgi:hypothetical protein
MVGHDPLRPPELLNMSTHAIKFRGMGSPTEPIGSICLPELLADIAEHGFTPFGDDRCTPRDTARAKIRARVEGTTMAAEQSGV